MAADVDDDVDGAGGFSDLISVVCGKPCRAMLYASKASGVKNESTYFDSRQYSIRNVTKDLREQTCNTVNIQFLGI